MRFNVDPYRKAVVAIVGGLVVIATAVGEAVSDGVLDFADGLAIAAAIGTALGVYGVANKPAEETAGE